MPEDEFLKLSRDKSWTNFHATVNVPTKGVWKIRNPSSTASLENMKATAERIQARADELMEHEWTPEIASAYANMATTQTPRGRAAGQFLRDLAHRHHPGAYTALSLTNSPWAAEVLAGHIIDDPTTIMDPSPRPAPY